MSTRVSFLTCLRSWVYALAYICALLLYGIPASLIGMFSSKTGYAITKAWVKAELWLLKIICGLDYKVTGKEHIPDQACVVLTRHQATWETMAQIAFLPRQTWVLKKSLLNIPMFGWTLRATLKPIAIDRTKPREAFKSVLIQGKSRLAEGIFVTVFPEGSRMPVGTIGKLAAGGAKLAIEAGVPVLPVNHNAGEYWLHGSVNRKPGCINVSIGPLIDTKDKSVDDINQQVQAWFEHSLKQSS